MHCKQSMIDGAILDPKFIWQVVEGRLKPPQDAAGLKRAGQIYVKKHFNPIQQQDG